MSEISKDYGKPSKKDVTRALLLRTGTIFIHLNPRSAQTYVPVKLRNQDQVVLQIGLDMPVPIPDLRVDDEGIYATLSFHGVAYTCSVPWKAVFAVVGDDAKGMVYEDDMPESIKKQLSPPPSPKLRLVKNN